MQPRPGLAIKRNHKSFFEGYPSSTTISGRPANTFAYFHGFDVDGNPSDVKPYVSEDGDVKYLENGFIHGWFGNVATRQKYEGNTFYIMYSDTAWSGMTGSLNSFYTICQPVGNDDVRFPDNNGDYTWRRIKHASSTGGWIYFNPNEESEIVVGEGRFGTSAEHSSEGVTSAAAILKDLKVYQFSRSAESIRESYNFNIRREDFQNGELGNHFFANADFWAEPNGLLNGTFIAAATIGNAAILDLSASKIQTGTIEAKVTVGGETKVLIDGINSRIVISD